MRCSKPPKVGIGLPVRDGERYLATAIRSILAQTYDNFELFISDNASTDRTQAISQAFAAQDPRVHYYRQSANCGAAANFNHVFALARSSQYFKWAACDDWIAPTFLEQCVTALEDEPTAVLCQGRVEIVDDDDCPLEAYDHAVNGTGAARASDRFGGRLRGRRCMDVFGVIRTDVLATTALIASHLGADRTLLLELALCGRFLSVPEVLMYNRDHRERFTRQSYTPEQELAWYTPGTGGHRAWRTWTLYRRCVQLIRSRVDDPIEAYRCYSHLLRSLSNLRLLSNLVTEPIVGLDPRLFHGYYRLKRTLRGHRSRPIPTAPVDPRPPEEAQP